MKKKYIINGLIETFIKVREGKKVYTFHFNKGAVSGAGRVPASYITSNANEQKLIEALPKFKSGQIRIAEAYKTAEEEKATKGNIAVTTLQQAREILMANGATMEELQTKAAVLAAAEKLNIAFPDLK